MEASMSSTFSGFINKTAFMIIFLNILFALVCYDCFYRKHSNISLNFNENITHI